MAIKYSPLNLSNFRQVYRTSWAENTPPPTRKCYSTHSPHHQRTKLMSNDFRLLMLSAMYENGGNTTHRFLDGHPQMFVYPFESQVGTRMVNDHLSSLFPVKYRWPVFALDATPEQDYK